MTQCFGDSVRVFIRLVHVTKIFCHTVANIREQLRPLLIGTGAIICPVNGEAPICPTVVCFGGPIVAVEILEEMFNASIHSSEEAE